MTTNHITNPNIYTLALIQAKLSGVSKEELVNALGWLWLDAQQNIKPNPLGGKKDLSYLDASRGGALVKPAEWKRRKRPNLVGQKNTQAPTAKAPAQPKATPSQPKQPKPPHTTPSPFKEQTKPGTEVELGPIQEQPDYKPEHETHYDPEDEVELGPIQEQPEYVREHETEHKPAEPADSQRVAEIQIHETSPEQPAQQANEPEDVSEFTNKPTVKGTLWTIARMVRSGTSQYSTATMDLEDARLLAVDLADHSVAELNEIASQLRAELSGDQEAYAREIASWAWNQAIRNVPLEGPTDILEEHREPLNPGESVKQPGDEAGPERTRVEPGGGEAGNAVPGGPEGNGPGMAPKAPGPQPEETGGGGEDFGESLDFAADRDIPRPIAEVNRRIDKYARFYRSKGIEDGADLIDELKKQISTLGVQAALDSFGEENTWEGQQEVLYSGYGDLTPFAEKYLKRSGITPLTPDIDLATEERPVISAITPGEGDVVREHDFYPSLPELKNKLEEAKHIRGLEKTEDLGVLTGKELGAYVPQINKEVTDRLDEVYGKNGWLIKPYSDQAYANYGIFFPQWARRVQAIANINIWNYGQALSKLGYSITRQYDKKTGKLQITGIRDAQGNKYPFGKIFWDIVWEEDGQKNAVIKMEGTPEFNKLPDEVKKLASVIAASSTSTDGASLPVGSYMAQPAYEAVGVTEEDRANGHTYHTATEGRIHILTREGKAEQIPYSTGLKDEHSLLSGLLPVVFENEETREMARVAQEEIAQKPESERQGQLYGVDVLKTPDGWKVVELNPAGEGGSSGWLDRSPLVMDAYVSYLTGKDPTHVQFIRNLLRKKPRRGEKSLTKSIKVRPRLKVVSRSPFRKRRP